MHDMPLVIFTILSQLVIGGFVTLWWIDKKTKGISKKTGLTISIVLVLLTGISLLVSMLHLGQPLHAYRAILNVDESWLSREILFYGLFFGVSLLYTWFWLKDDASNRNKVGWGLSVAGVLAIFSSAMIYFIPSIPAWNGLTTIMMFFLTSLILGPLFVGAFLQIRGELQVNITGFSVGSIFAGLLVLAIYVFSLFGGLPEATETVKLMTSQVIFWIRIVTFIGAFILLGMAYRNKGLRTATIYSIAFAVLAVSEFLSRYQFYETAVHL